MVRAVDEPQDSSHAEPEPDVGGQEQLQEQLARLEKHLATFTIIGFLLAGYLVYELAQVWSDHPKTLARDALIAGFLGAVLVVRELVRKLLSNLRGVTVGLFSSVGGAVLGVVGLELIVVVGILAGVTFVYRFVVTVAERVWDLPALRKKIAAGLTPVALGLGLLLLLLSMFLQLRAIELGNG
jgi:hypothetical protein